MDKNKHERATAIMHYRDRFGRKQTIPVYGTPGYCGNRSLVLVTSDGLGWDAVLYDADLDESLGDWDEDDKRRHVDPADLDLADYDGATPMERVWKAVDDGDIRCNGGGTFAWVGCNETWRTFHNAAAVLAELREHE